MKKLFLSLLFFAGTAITIAQVEKQEKEIESQENNLDKIEQEPVNPAQVNLDRSTRIEARRIKMEKADKKRVIKQNKAKAKQTAVKQDTLHKL